VLTRFSTAIQKSGRVPDFFLFLEGDPLRAGSPPSAHRQSSLLHGSSLTKSHLSRNHWAEETGQVTSAFA